jgi:hypothetical protein
MIDGHCCYRFRYKFGEHGYNGTICAAPNFDGPSMGSQDGVLAEADGQRSHRRIVAKIHELRPDKFKTLLHIRPCGQNNPMWVTVANAAVGLISSGCPSPGFARHVPLFDHRMVCVERLGAAKGPQVPYFHEATVVR